MGHPLDSVALRLTRADEHLEALGDEIERFLNPSDAHKPYGSFLEKNDETGERRLCASVHLSPPPHLSLLIGDFLHNVRSALDHLAWKLGGNPPPNEKASEFPIFLSRKDFCGSAGGRSGYEKTRGMEPRAQAIIEDVQPFNGGKNPKLHPLWTLHQLSAEDKHRLPIVTGLVVEGGIEPQLRPGDPDSINLAVTDWRGVIRQGAFQIGDPIAEWTAGTFTREPESHEDFNIVFGIAFNPEGPGRGRPVIDVLADCIEYVGGEVVGRLAPFA
jgi:hypothetical protein